MRKEVNTMADTTLRQLEKAEARYRRAQADAEERRLERLNSYYTRNYEGFFEWQKGSWIGVGDKPERVKDAERWLEDNVYSKRK